MLQLSENPLLKPQPATAGMPAIRLNPILHPRCTSAAAAERELHGLPHLHGDRRLVVKEIKRRCEDARNTKTAAEAIGRLPAADEAIHLAISGRYALWNCVPAILALAECSIDILHVATLGFSKSNIDDMAELLDAGQIGAVSLLASHYFKGTSTGIYEHAVEQLAKRPGTRFLSCRQHAKLLLIALADGRFVSVESSANLRSCKNIETVTLIGSPEVYRFHRSWIESLFAEAGR